MDFAFSEENIQYREAAREFGDRYIRPFAHEWDTKSEFTTPIHKQLGDAGFLGLCIPQEYGGLGASYLTYALVVEEINRADTSVRTIMSVHNSLMASTLNEWATEEQKQRWLPGMASGELMGCFGLTEPNAGSWAVNQQTRGIDKGDFFLVNGVKCWISCGDTADIALCFATVDPNLGHRGIFAFVAEKASMKGFRAGKGEPKMGCRAAHATELIFEDCEVPKENLIGEVGDGFAIAMAALDHGRFSVASGSVGVAQACVDSARDYALQRITYDVPIAQHQAVKLMMGEMVIDTEAARLLCLRAGFLKDQHVRSTRETSIAKYFATEVANRNAYKAVQIFGGNGYSAEYDVERYYRDARVLTIYEGTSEIQRMIIADYEFGYRKDKATPKLGLREPALVA